VSGSPNLILTNWLEVLVGLALQAVRYGENLHQVPRPGIEIREDHPRVVSCSHDLIQSVVANAVELVFVLTRVDVALPADVETVHQGSQVFDYRGAGLRHHVQVALVGFHVFRQRLDYDGVVPAREESVESQSGLVVGFDVVAVAGGALHLVVRDEVVVLGTLGIGSPGYVDDAVLVVGVGDQIRHR
jgi:hypothetical protein